MKIKVLAFVIVLLSMLFIETCKSPTSPEQIEECLIPRLISPQNGAVLDNGCTGERDVIEWDFSWYPTKTFDFYQLYVIGPHATKPLIKISTRWDIIGTSYHYESTSHIIDRDRLNWKWRVRAGYTEGNILEYMWEVWCPWSEWRYFDVEPLNTDCSTN